MIKKLFKLYVILLVCLNAGNVQAQCALGTAYYWQTHTPSVVNTPVISTGTWKQNIVYINVVAGNSYSTGNCALVNGTNSTTATGTSITVRQASAGAVIAYQSGPGAQCATFTAPLTGVVWAYVYKDDCTVEGSGFTYGSIWIGCTVPKNLAATAITYESANLSWTSGGGTAPIGYEYAVTTSATPPASGTYTTGTTYNPTGLNFSTNYYLHVRAKCGATDFSGWATLPFTTAANPCVSPTGLSATNTTVTSMDLSWFPVAGSTGYEYILDQTASTPSVPGTPTSTTGFSATGLSGGTTYYLHVRNRCSPTSVSNWAVMSFPTLPCNSPVSILKSNITDSSIDLAWSVMTNGHTYEYQIDQSYDAPVSSSGITTTTGMTAHTSGLMPNTKYYFHIRTLCFVSDVSTWGLDSFTTSRFCAPPSLTVDAAGSGKPRVSWTAIEDAVAYEYAVRTTKAEPAFGNEINDVTVSPVLPPDGKDYYIHVRSKCNSMFDFSTWSVAALRESTTGVANVNNGIDIEVYPNPATNILNIHTSEQRENAVMIMSDIFGKEIKTIQLSKKDEKVDMAHLPAGVYLLKYMDGSYTETIKLNKL